MGLMDASEWVRLIAVVGLFALALLSFARGGKSALGRPVGALVLDLGGLHFSVLAEHLTGAARWVGVHAVLTPLAPPLVLHVVTLFVGGRQAARRAVVAAYLAFGAIALVSALGFVVPALDGWAGGRGWALLVLAGWIPTLLLALALLLLHLAGTSAAEEKGATRTMLAALAVAGTAASTDLVASAGYPLPRLAAAGALAAALLLATAAFRFRLFDREVSSSAALYGGVMVAVAVVAYVVVFRLLGRSLAPLLLGAAALTAIVVVAARELAVSSNQAKAQSERLAMLGRFAAQMAHDTKNPLTAIVGAGQVLLGTTLTTEQREYVDLLLEQTTRIRAIAERYERLGRVEPALAQVDLEALIARVTGAQRMSAKSVAFHVEVAPGAARCTADPDLLEGALENLVRNAIEAMPSGGTLWVRAAEDAGAVLLQVEDTGEGMDARRAYRAFEEFYTTKRGGSGLGLPFVRRVAEGHGGEASIRSRPGEGTMLQIRLPHAATARRA